MTEEKKVYEGKVIPPKAKGVSSALDAFGALNQIVESARECFLVHEQESTKRARLHAYEQTEVAKIKAAETILRDYFGQVFAERRAVYEEMFDAARPGDGARTSPRWSTRCSEASSTSHSTRRSRTMGDLGQIRAALDDPDQVWEL